MLGALAARCLGDDTILTFAQGLIEDTRAEEVRVHLDECDECRALVAEAGRAIYDDASGLKTALDNQLDSEQLLPGSAIDRYIIVGMVGQGGMGVVYSAFDPQLRRKVAVKLLRPDSHDVDASGESRLLREAQAMAQLSHPNVVQVYDLGVAGNQVFVAMEYVEGLTLARWLKSEPRTLDQILDAFAWAGIGLSAAHAAGIVHRDFKTSNVLLSADGRVRVTDFGLARGIAEVDARSPTSPPTPRSAERMFLTVTETGAMIGTPAYMAPEQFEGAACDARADQFSFCAALYEALYGVHPFADALGTSMPSLLGTLGPRPLGTAVPMAIHAVLERGLSRDPAARFSSMEELLAALDWGRTAAVPRRAGGGSRIALVAATLTGGLAVLLLALWLGGDRTAAPASPPTVTPPTGTAPPRAPVPAPAAAVESADAPTAVVVDEPAADVAPDAGAVPAEADSTIREVPARSSTVRSREHKAPARKTSARRRERTPAAAHSTGPKENPDGLIRDLWTTDN